MGPKNNVAYYIEFQISQGKRQFCGLSGPLQSIESFWISFAETGKPIEMSFETDSDGYKKPRFRWRSRSDESIRSREG